MPAVTRRHFVAFGAAALLAGCTSAMAPSGSTSPRELSQEAILAAINGTRAKNGKPPLKYNVRLEAAARTLGEPAVLADSFIDDLAVHGPTAAQWWSYYASRLEPIDRA